MNSYLQRKEIYLEGGKKKKKKITGLFALHVNIAPIIIME